MSVYQQYKRYDTGGSMTEDPTKKNSAALSGAIGAGAGFIGSVADALDPPNQYGKQGMGTNILKNVGTYAAAGSSFGPIGTAAGAVIGAGIGVIQGKKQAEEQARQINKENGQMRMAQLSQYQARAAQDPSITTGIKGQDYFEGGGTLFAEFSKFKAKGGTLSKLDSDSVEVKGPSHANGGVDLNTGDEVEGGETIKGDYVFSHKLGFAQLHKPLAKAIGKLEQRPATKTTLNSLENLRKRERALMFLQETVREQNNLS